ncbi:Conserved_hypothetical protein [Hexamita inflata]|uniref:Uncharacterized protein n=1 Tax=Hexamita inflata TaxID=28002 RepID=A0AA86UF03_9EUKA|nr:Conserved hypothetical protein [Hexamita inflata]
MNVNSFALFGLNVNSQFIKDSILNVTLQFQVFVGALVCIICDVQVYNASLVFIAFGQQVSAMVIEVQSTVQIELTFVQYRIQSQNSSGLVNVINQQLTIFSINDCKLSGSNLVQSETNGYIMSKAVQNVTIIISHFSVCMDSTSRLGKFSVPINVIGIESMRCDICTNKYVVYGICADQLQYAELFNGRVLCVYPFEFVNDTCACASGYLLNGSKCINVLSAITNMQNSLNNDQIKKIEQDISLIQSEIYVLDQSIANNVSNIINAVGVDLSALEQNILSNFSEAEYHISANMSLLDGRISGNVSAIYNVLNLNISVINQYLLQNVSISDSHLDKNSSVIDVRLFNNISALNSSAQANLSSLINAMNYQQEIIDSLQKQIICRQKPGYQFVNGTCTFVSCPIKDQQTINGVCQCTGVNQIVSGSSCACPVNASLIQNACVCSITGQIIMQRVCQCQTSGAFVDNGACTCGVGAVNESNVCKCPPNSSLIGGKCQCNVIGQNIVNGACACAEGQIVVNNVCQYIHSINTNNFTCNQEIFVSTFDIQIVSYTIVSANFSGGYVFNTATVIQSAFVDVSDNVYSTVKPLFQSQASFTNLKIQVGSQSAAGGSFLSNSDTIVINQLNIISRAGSQITASSGQVNILVTSSTNANVSNLLVDLSFAVSWGNIALINSVTSSMNINNYQVLGSYQSQGCVVLGAVSIISATITITNFNFMATNFNVGNYSSYLFSTISQSNINLNYIAIILGNQSYSQISNSIVFSTSSYQFGGLVCYQTNTTLIVIQLISDCNQTYKTKQIQSSGLLVGNADLGLNNIQFQNICLSQIILCQQQLTQFGLIGRLEGKITFHQSNIIFIALNPQVQMFGIVGILTNLCQFSNFSQLYVQIQIIPGISSFGMSSSLIGYSNAQQLIVSQTTVSQANISSSYSTGSLFGAVEFSKLQLSTLIVDNCTITASTYNAGGFIGYSFKSNISISDAIVQFTKLLSPSYKGLVLGRDGSGNSFTINGSQSRGENLANGVVLETCGNLNNFMSVKGC